MAQLIEHTVAANIRRLRGRHNVSLSELSRRSGVAKATLWSLEAGNGNPTIQTLSALADALTCALGDLIERDGTQLLRNGEGTWIDGPATSGRLIARLVGSRGVDVHEVHFKEGLPWKDQPLPGSTEHVYVLEGVFEAGGPGECIEIVAGDLIRFPAAETYVIRAVESPARALFFISSTHDSPPGVSGATVAASRRGTR